MKKDNNRFKGKLFGFYEGLLHGWVYDSRDLTERIVVEIYADDYPLGIVRAETWVPDLAEQGIGDACYGFWLRISLAKRVHIQNIRARVANTDYWLSGLVDQAREMTTLRPPLLGYVVNSGGLRVQGWAWDPVFPKHAVGLRFYEDDRLLCEIIANQLIIDPAEAELGEGKHGFNFNLPGELADGRVHRIRVVDEHNRPLQGGPLVVAAFPSGFSSEMKRLNLAEPEKNFIETLAKRCEQLLPDSLDFELYREWFARFGKPNSDASSPFAFLVVVFGVGDIGSTVESLLGQSHGALQIIVKGSFEYCDDRVEILTDRDWPCLFPERLRRHQGLVCYVEAGDTLAPEALSLVGGVFADPDVQLAYSDCDYRQGDETCLPWFKPDWDLDLFLASDPLQHLLVVRAQLLPAESPWSLEPKAWSWLAVNAVGDNGEAIRHIADVLYHRHRQHCLAEYDQTIAAEFLPLIAPDAEGVTAASDYPSVRTIQWSAPNAWPKVSLIIPTRDQQDLLERCIDSLLKTDYPDLEIIVVDNDSQQPAIHRYFKKLTRQGIRILPYPHRFNYSAINNWAVEQAQGDVIGLINNDVEAIEPDWLSSMVRQLLRPNIGAVGAKLLWPNGMVQHGGVLLGLHGLIGHVGNHWEQHDSGYFGYNQLVRRASAVTAACLICFKRDYQLLGGLNEQAFPVAFNDVDFCLRLRKSGKHIVWTPEATLWHKESASRGRDAIPEKQARFEKEKRNLKERWGHLLFEDPFYNPNLNLDHYSHKGLAFPPRHKV
ncbi:glycosyltransferase family 2 protein [Methylotuvimicrobium buryatense]|uniref:Glycosyltransferase n=1 Tax=Methylotuvimicrobium buryatense TaxID=95641 RepID=A0A4P9UTQ5_METBY|nr:glycosyltransferase family 2 protein [Methylotuvimicrobium buryatense]QCW83983.1 glycosyltransferase [Methylotuvimicrobium buryatense]